MYVCLKDAKLDFTDANLIPVTQIRSQECRFGLRMYLSPGKIDLALGTRVLPQKHALGIRGADLALGTQVQTWECRFSL